MKYQHTEHHLLPSKKQLARSTLIAFLSSIVILVTIVLPAEYGIDPTRIGKLIGLTRMGEIKTQLAREAHKDEREEVNINQDLPSLNSKENTNQKESDASEVVKQEQLLISLKPDEWVEIKLTMNANSIVKYSWNTTSSVVNWDLHGDSFDKTQKAKYSNGKSASSESGEFTAKFDGKHGWFWRNRTRELVTIQLNANGQFSSIEEIRREER